MTIWLQADLDGGLFIGRNGKTRVHFQNGVEKLLSGVWPDKGQNAYEKVYITALTQNAGLISRIKDVTDRLKISSVILCRPIMRSLPAGAITYAEFPRHIDRLPPSLGGCRLIGPADIFTYAITDTMMQGSGDLELVKFHPAWPAFSALPQTPKEEELMILAANKLIALIGDPRWYVDPNRSDSSKKLVTAFGLGRDGLVNMNIIRSGKIGGKAVEYASTVIDAWSCGIDITKKELFQPAAWVTKDFLKYTNPAQGMLMASRRFLKAVCSIWLDNLTPPRNFETKLEKLESEDKVNRKIFSQKLMPAKKYSPQLFIPEHEFTANELEAWKVHIGKWRKEYGKVLYPCFDPCES